MNLSSYRLRGSLLVLIVLLVSLISSAAFAAGAGGDTYTACLTPSGQLTSVSEGTSPARACTKGQTEIHLAGAAAIGALQSEVDALTARTADLEQTIFAMQADLQSLTYEVAELTAKADANGESIVELATIVDRHEEYQGTDGADTAVLKQIVATNTANIIDLREQYQGTDGADTARLEQIVATNTAAIDDLRGTLDTLDIVAPNN